MESFKKCKKIRINEFVSNFYKEILAKFLIHFKQPTNCI